MWYNLIPFIFVIDSTSIFIKCIWSQYRILFQKGTLRGTRLAMKYLSADNGGKGGAIVNMASMAGNSCLTSVYTVVFH